MFLIEGVKISSDNLSQLTSLYGSNIHNITPNHFAESIILALKAHKAFKQFDPTGTGYISYKSLSIILNHFGFSMNLKESIDDIISLLEGNEERLYEFEELFTIIMSIEKLCRHFNSPTRDNSIILNICEVHSILLSFGIGLSVDEIYEVVKRIDNNLSMNWGISEYIKMLMNIKKNESLLRSVTTNLRKSNRINARIRNDVHMYEENKKYIESSEYQRLDSIITECKESNILFNDPEYPPSNLMFVGRPDLESRVAGWKRPSEIAKNPSLFVEGPYEGELNVNLERNNWYFSAISILASAGNRNLEKIFVSKYPQYGLYQCIFYKDGDWVVVTIDDRLPVDEDGKPAFGSCRDPNEFWVPLLEKAYSKLYGSYSAIHTGKINEAILDFSGEPNENIEIVYSRELWDILKLNSEEKWLMGCTCYYDDSERDDLGILKYHTYNIIRCLEVDEFKIVHLRNPWGHSVWKGRWSKGSRQWTEELISKIQPTFSDGELFMDFGDWCKQFSHLHVLRISDTENKKWSKTTLEGSWTTKTAGGSTNFPSWSYNPQYKFYSEHDENIVFVSLSHRNKRGENEKKLSYPALGIIVMVHDDISSDYKKKEAYSEEIVAISTYREDRDVTVEFVTSPDKAYIIMPTTYEPNHIGKFYMTIQHKYQGTITSLEGDKPSIIHGVWSAQSRTNGGGLLSPSWRDSPQYLLKVTEKCSLKLILTQDCNNPLAPMAFTIFKNGEDTKRKLIQGNFHLLPQSFIESESVTCEVQFEEGNYCILCSTKFNEENSFNLKIFGPKDKYSLQNVEEYTRYSIHEKWDDKLCGGCKNHETWINNPRFALIMKEKGDITFVVKLNEICKDVAVGFYVFSLVDQSKPQLIGKSKFKHLSVSERLTLDTGNYLILPCTFDPGIKKEFDLDIYTDAQIQVFNVRTKEEVLPS